MKLSYKPKEFNNLCHYEVVEYCNNLLILKDLCTEGSVSLTNALCEDMIDFIFDICKVDKDAKVICIGSDNLAFYYHVKTDSFTWI
ncbi:MAG: hypothetical protein ACRCX2_36655 [Paraclostridium sp.]